MRRRNCGQVERDGKTAHLSGAITLETVPAIYRDTRIWKKRRDLPERVDLARIERVDSACVALLLEWASWARSNDTEMLFANPPGALCALVRLFDIEKVLLLENACAR